MSTTRTLQAGFTERDHVLRAKARRGSDYDKMMSNINGEINLAYVNGKDSIRIPVQCPEKSAPYALDVLAERIKRDLEERYQVNVSVEVTVFHIIVKMTFADVS